MDITLACIRDRDFDISAPSEESSEGILIATLDRKEAENYLFDPKVLAEAFRTQAGRREQRKGEQIASVTEQQFQEQLDAILQKPEVREKVRYQVVPQYRNSLSPDRDDSTKEQMADEWFKEQWADPEWRICFCPGKQVLGSIRSWCQNEFGITLTDRALCEAITECPADIKQVAEKITQFFYGASSQR